MNLKLQSDTDHVRSPQIGSPTGRRFASGLPARAPVVADLHANSPWPVALALAPYGLKIFALWGIREVGGVFVCESGRKASPGKMPRAAGWQAAATDDPLILQGYARKYPRGNVGLHTGQASGVVVIDVDGQVGVESLEEAEAVLGPLPPTVRSRSGRVGVGFHLWFRLRENEAPKNSAGRLGSGIDTRGQGGFIAIPGSRHKSGNRYVWEVAPDEVAFAHLPKPWMAKLTESAVVKASVRFPTGRTINHTGASRTVATSSRIIGDGPGRGGFNGPLYSLACRYFAAQPDAPMEPLIAAMIRGVEMAPKDKGRDVSRYLDAGYLVEQAQRAKAFISAKAE
ncbi:MAG: bifunctional DNA primase/polymerase [Cypionkella sp.]